MAVHEAGHAVIGRVHGFEVDALSVRPGTSHAGLTLIRSPRFEARDSAAISWDVDPNLGLVVGRRQYVLAGDVAEGLLSGTGRVAAPSADAARAAFEALPEPSRARLLKAEAATEGISDPARAWAIAVDFCGPDAKAFLDLVNGGVRRSVAERSVAIVNVALELQHGSVLDGLAVDTIIAVGEPVEAAGRPTSGTWTPITTAFVADIEQAARVGETYPWHDARVQHAPGLFLPGDGPSEAIEKGEGGRNRLNSPPPWRWRPDLRSALTYCWKP